MVTLLLMNRYSAGAEIGHVIMVVLGKYEPDHAYQRAVKEAASDEVVFPGAIYDKAVVQALGAGSGGAGARQRL